MEVAVSVLGRGIGVWVCVVEGGNSQGGHRPSCQPALTQLWVSWHR